MQKIMEEYEELKKAYEEGDNRAIREELGDLLFSVANVSRFLGIDPEESLNESTEKFIERFAYIEENSGINGKTIEDISLDEMDRLWAEAKKIF